MSDPIESGVVVSDNTDVFLPKPYFVTYEGVPVLYGNSEFPISLGVDLIKLQGDTPISYGDYFNQSNRLELGFTVEGEQVSGISFDTEKLAAIEPAMDDGDVIVLDDSSQRTKNITFLDFNGNYIEDIVDCPEQDLCNIPPIKTVNIQDGDQIFYSFDIQDNNVVITEEQENNEQISVIGSDDVELIMRAVDVIIGTELPKLDEDTGVINPGSYGKTYYLAILVNGVEMDSKEIGPSEDMMPTPATDVLYLPSVRTR